MCSQADTDCSRMPALMQRQVKVRTTADEEQAHRGAAHDAQGTCAVVSPLARTQVMAARAQPELSSARTRAMRGRVGFEHANLVHGGLGRDPLVVPAVIGGLA